MRTLGRSHTSSSSSSSSSPSSWIHIRSLLYVAASSASSSSLSSSPPCSSSPLQLSSSSSSSSFARRSRLKSPWSRRRRKHALSGQQWNSFFSSDGRLLDGGVKLLKKVRSGGIESSIRKEVWPFLLGVYQLNSTKSERDAVSAQKRKEYEKLRRQCKHLLKNADEHQNSEELRTNSGEEGASFLEDLESPCSEDVVSARQSLSMEGGNIDDCGRAVSCTEDQPDSPDNLQANSCITVEAGCSTPSPVAHTSVVETESSDSESSTEEDSMQTYPTIQGTDENDTGDATNDPVEEKKSRGPVKEDYATWQRIIRLDAIRANTEWVSCWPAQAEVSEEEARRCAESVGLKDYNHLEASVIYHAARLVTILEAYAIYDPEIGYCQGMSDLLSPIIAVMEEDYEAFWCFVGFMKKARHNFRLDEVGIRRQLNLVSKIIKLKDSHLYKHLEKLKAEDCFFVYRMVVVLFRRELNFEQTLCLWEVMWADQAAIRAGIGKSAWGRIRQRAPPTNDLLLYAIAACVLQRRKLIIEKYSSMDEIIRECNNMTGQLDVWKLLDDAHDLVVTLHDKI
ncbi:unnamed protein product [Victoria cruziana]